MGILSFLGGGAPQINQFQPDQSKFTNVVGNQAPAWQQAQNNYLGQTTGAAPVIQAAQTAAPTELAQMQGLGQTLQNTANGIGPSVAAQTAANQSGVNYAQALGALGAPRGGTSPAMAAYLGQQAQGNAGLQTAQVGALGRAGEAATAAGQLGQVQNNIAGYQQGTNQFNTGALNTIAQQNAANNLSNRGLNNTAYTNNIGSLAQQTGISNQANQNEQSLAENAQNAYNTQFSTNQNAADARGIQMVGALGSSASAAFGSDKRIKFNIKPAHIAMRELLSSTQPRYLGASHGL
jgi:hypothetical protein